MRATRTAALSGLALLLAAAGAQAADDILIADFEGKDYGASTVTGEAFGPGPASSTSPSCPPRTGRA